MTISTSQLQSARSVPGALLTLDVCFLIPMPFLAVLGHPHSHVAEEERDPQRREATHSKP